MFLAQYWAVFGWFLGCLGALISLTVLKYSKLSMVLSQGSAAFATVGIARTALIVMQQGVPVQLDRKLSLSVRIALQMDRFAGLFILLFCLIGFAVCIYSCWYYTQINLTWVGSLQSLLLLSVYLMFVSNNTFTFLLGWELMNLGTVCVLQMSRQGYRIRKACFVYLMAAHISIALLLTACLLMDVLTGAHSFNLWSSHSALLTFWMRRFVWILFAAGLGLQAAAFPFYRLRTLFDSVLPIPAVVLLYTATFNVALYWLCKLNFGVLAVRSDALPATPAWISSEGWWGAALCIWGSITAFYAAIQALSLRQIKSWIRCYSAVQFGLALVTIGVGLFLHTYGLFVLVSSVLRAVFLQALTYSLVSTVLLFADGALERNIHTKSRQIVSIFCLLAGVSVTLFPLFGGFTSYWVLFQALLLLPFHVPIFAVQALACAALAIVVLSISICTVSFLSLYGVMFLGKRSQEISALEEQPLGWLPLSVLCCLTGLLLLIGLFAKVVVWMFERALLSVYPTVTGYGELPALSPGWTLASPYTLSNFSSGAILIAALMVAIFGYVLLDLFSLKRTKQEVPAWNGGHPQVLPIEGVADGISQQLLALLSFVSWPVTFSWTKAGLWLTICLRRFQNRSIQFYLGYVFLTLIVLLLFAR